MKRKKSWYIVLLFAIFLFSVLANSIKTEATSTPILSSPDVSIINGKGVIIGGNNNLNFRNVIPLAYFGTSTDIDTTVSVNNAAPTTVSGATTYAPGAVFRVANVGYYNGQPLTFAFKSTNKKLRVAWSKGVLTPVPSSNAVNSNPSYEIWLEDSAGKELSDPNVKILFPFFAMTNFNSSGTAGYVFQNFLPINNIAGNLIVRNSTTIDSRILPYVNVDITNNSTGIILTTSQNYFNYLFVPSGHLTIDSTSTQSGAYPNGVLSTGINNALGFLDSNAIVLIPLYNSAPFVVDTVTDDRFQADISLIQGLYGQSDDSFYPSTLTITVELPEILKIVDSIGNFKIIDKKGTDITSQVVISSESDTTLKISIPQATLKSLGSNEIKIQGLVDIDQSDSDFMTYYNSDTGYFTFPVTAKNTDSDVINSGKAKVKMPGPTADPVPQTVSLGTSTDDLLPRDLVTNLSSLVPNDVVSVVGFKEKKTFSALGSDNVVVQIKSEKTGTVSDITIPINVVSQPVVVDQANLSWSNTMIELTKNEEVNSAEVSGVLSEEFYWQTTFTNKRYQLVVKKGSTILTQKLAESTSTGDNSWLKESIDIPFDQLSEGENNLTIGIYVLKADGSLKGGPLSLINLTVDVINDNAKLSWNNDNSNLQKIKTETLDKSTMEDALVETLYWQTQTEDRDYLLVTKNSSGAVAVSQTVSNGSLVNQFQQMTISIPTNGLNYGDNIYKVGIYAKNDAGEAIGNALDEVNLTVTVTGSLQLVSIPETIDFNLQNVDPKKIIRVDDPTINGALVIADTRNSAANNWVVKVTLTKPLQTTNTSGRKITLPNALKYKAPGKDEFIVTEDAQEIESKTDGYGKFNISSEWGTQKDSAGFKFETLPSNIGALGEYTGEITYTISDTFEP